MLRFIEFTIPNIAHITIPSYALFACIGLLCMMLLLYFRIQKTEIEFKYFLLLIFCMTVGVGIGSKLLFIITKIPDIVDGFTWQKTFQIIITSGFVFYGGLFGAIIGLYIFTKAYGLPFGMLANITAPGFPLFHMWGRVGCFFAGCCYGREASWGIALENDPNVPRIPIQLIESGCILSIFLVLLYLEKAKQDHSQLLCIYLSLYSICRLILEIFRGDAIRGIWAGLSTSQWISIGLFVGTSFFLWAQKSVSNIHTKC